MNNAVKLKNNPEELANVITHALGLFLSIVGIVIMLEIAWHREWIAIVAAVVFSLSLFLLYLASTLYHLLFYRDQIIAKLRIMDHSAIYLLIAGTYTPFTLLVLPQSWGLTLFFIVWAMAIIGIVFKIFYIGRFKIVSTILYLGMGWLGVIAIQPMLKNLPTEGLWWLLAGGLSYSAGVVFYLWKKMPFHHAVWHLFVLGGSISHFVSIYCYVF